LELDDVSVHEEVVAGANLTLVVVPALDLDAVLVHEELLGDTERGTSVVTVSVSSTVGCKVTVMVVVSSVCPGVRNPKNYYSFMTREPAPALPGGSVSLVGD
jgi:hypothetical protein